MGSGGIDSAGGTPSTGGALGSGGVPTSSGGSTSTGGGAPLGTGRGLTGSGGAGASPRNGRDRNGWKWKRRLEPIIGTDVVTSSPGQYWQAGELTVTTDAPTITVNDTQVLGAGAIGGTFNEKGWEALKAVSDADRARALSLLFDRADGAAFTYGRIPIGSSDYALNRYSLNETANDFRDG